MIKDFFRKRKIANRLRKKKNQVKPNQYELDFFETHLFSFEKAPLPLVTIIIPVYNQIKFTLNCLYSIYNNLKKEDKVEIIIINDNSIDSTLEYLNKIKGLTIINNKENKGFLLNINEGIRQAKGEYIYLLNNDTEVQPSFLSNLLDIFYTKDNVGAVGSMLMYPDGRLQEAGCLIYENSEIVNLGRLDVMENPHYSFVRKVDYCSRCSLLFRRLNLQGNLNLLDEIYKPAYYEETDLCMSFIYKQGLDIYYQPASKIIHFEEVSYTNNDSNREKELVEKNRNIFLHKWGNTFTFPRMYKSNKKEYINFNKYYKKTILILEQVLPKHDLDSGSRRFTEIVKILVKKNYKVYLALSYFDKEYDEKYIKYFEQLGVEVIRNFIDKKNRLRREKEQLKEIASIIDYVWIFRPETFEHWYSKLQKLNFKSEIIYDMLDIHHLRLERELEFLEPTKKRIKNIEKIKQQEFTAMKLADKIIAISSDEKNKLIELKINPDKIHVISNIHQYKKRQNSTTFENRQDILFIGGFKHTPNLDAVSFLYKDVMPLVWNENPEMEVFIIGNTEAEETESFTDKRFHMLGYVEDISIWFDKVKMSVAPLRYGAGVKGKIGQSLEYGLPVITTDIGAEGMFLKDKESALIANTKEELAQAILKLYEDKELWNRISNNSENALRPFSVEQLEIELTAIFKES